LQAEYQGGKIGQSVVGELYSRNSQSRDGFVDRAVRLGAGIGLGNSTAEQEAGRSIVALAGGDRAPGDRGPTTR
jgi:hypothetical protein